MTALLAGAASGAALLLLRAPSRSRASRLHAAVRSSPIGSTGRSAAEPGRRGSWRLVALAAPAVGVILGGPFALGLAGPVVLLVAAGARRRRSRRLVRARATAVVDVAFALAAELRAGHPPGRALAAAAAGAGPLELPLAAAAAAAASGAATVDELRQVARAPGCSGLRAIAAAWEVTERAGGPVADVLDRLGAAFDADAAGREALEATLAGPRTTMALLAGLPGLGVALGESVGAHPLRLLVHRPLGWGLLAAALTLDLAGVAWVAALSRRALRG